MSVNFFANCKTIEELKKEYRRLVIMYHPDNPYGDEETMKRINSDYDHMFNRLKNIHNAKTENTANHNTEQPEDFRNVINDLMKLDGLVIEICGSWIWLSGDTYKHKTKIKEMSFKWASNKKMWYLGELQGKQKHSMSMENIRIKYGSEVYASERVLCLA